MVSLPFDSAEIEQLVLRFNAVMAKEGTDISDPGGNASDDEVAATLQETAGDLSRDEIRQEIESMNDEQLDGLVALFWIGRGDAEPDGFVINGSYTSYDETGHRKIVSRAMYGKGADIAAREFQWLHGEAISRNHDFAARQIDRHRIGLHIELTRGQLVRKNFLDELAHEAPTVAMRQRNTVIFHYVMLPPNERLFLPPDQN